MQFESLQTKVLTAEVSESKFQLIAFGMYCYTFALTLLIPGLYWDDWITVNETPKGLLNTFVNAGLPVTGILHLALSPFAPFSYRFLAFSSHFASGYFFYKSILSSGFLTRSISRLILLFFIVLPLNLGRIIAINAPAEFYLSLFLLASYILFSSENRANRLAASFLFFVSMNVNSLLVFIFIPIGTLFVREHGMNFQTATVSKFIRKYFIVLLAPIFYWSVQKLFFPAVGPYAGYNAVTPGGLLTGFIDSKKAIDHSLLSPMILSVKSTSWYTLLIFVPILAVFNRFSVKQNIRTATAITLLGFLLLCIGAFPYSVVAKIPAVSDWENRHQLLAFPGAAVSLAGFMMFLIPRAQRVALPLLLSVFISFNQQTEIAFARDWAKQKALIELFKQEPVFRQNTTFVIEDLNQDLNVFNRRIRFYEYSGLLQTAFGDEYRIGSPNKDIETAMKLSSRNSHYNSGNYVFPPAKICDTKIAALDSPATIEVVEQLLRRDEFSLRLKLVESNCVDFASNQSQN